MANKLVLAMASLLDTCLSSKLVVIRAKRTAELPVTFCAGEHDLGEGYIELDFVGRERPFREVNVREEVIGQCHLKARSNGV